MPEDPQYYRFASIIQPPPSPLRESKSDAMKRSHGSMQKKCTPYNTLIFALAVLMAFSELAEKLEWKHGVVRESDWCNERENCAKGLEEIRIKKREEGELG